ncbi:hypothetical protein EGR_10809 [Echinococcus granulosus]|uniref:Uncharacterized protein n=1 Tax=Echinococcus granulosus TaxID=6210 RepID=W6ULD2_ECHGR|nr:hypothetical protein EGR_10809 [Echinococcus granulosus]EUB54334.1 hypothetical protein EGR_10809 [Echinococcus granulosus]
MIGRHSMNLYLVHLLADNVKPIANINDDERCVWETSPPRWLTLRHSTVQWRNGKS